MNLHSKQLKQKENTEYRNLPIWRTPHYNSTNIIMDNIGSKKYKLNIFSINNGLKEDVVCILLQNRHTIWTRIRTLLSKNCLAYRPCLKEIREIGRQLRKQPDKTNIM